MVQQAIQSGRIKIPVYGSGDMFSQADIVKFLKFTKAQGVLVARGAIHNPAMFEHTEQIINQVNDPNWKDEGLD